MMMYMYVVRLQVRVSCPVDNVLSVVWHGQVDTGDFAAAATADEDDEAAATGLTPGAQEQLSGTISGAAEKMRQHQHQHQHQRTV